MLDNLKKVNVLLLAPKFFGYGDVIETKLRENGAVVDYYDERSIDSLISKSILKFSNRIFKNHTLKYYKNLIYLNKNKNYKYIIVIKGDMLFEEVLTLLRINYRKAKIILYLWDSIENNRFIKNKFHLYDKVFTFDRNDSEKYDHLIFRPLFYSPFNKIERKELKYDLCFIGTTHSDRYKIIKNILIGKKENNFIYFYIQSKILFIIYKFVKPSFWNAKMSDFTTLKLSPNEVYDYTTKSKIIVDINHPKQSGLTMRTIQALGMKKKIATTNNDVSKYDFYNKNNVYIIDRENPRIPNWFIEEEYKEIDEKIILNYSVENWLHEILSL